MCGPLDDCQRHRRRAMTPPQAIDWQEMLAPGRATEVFVRGSLTYLGLLVLLRVGLKREAGSLGVADMLLVVLIADASQNAMSAEYRSVTDGFVLVATLLFWNYAVDRLAYHFPAFGRLLERPPVLLVKDGRYLRRNMR